MARIAYFRVSTIDQSIESQRQALGTGYDKEFIDEGVSGNIHAAERPGFSALLQYAREGDEVHVYSVDRLGRDALDVQNTVRELLAKGVAVHVNGLGYIGKGVGELILAVLAQIADMERHKIRARMEVGRERARAELMRSGLTHKGKPGLGRPPARNAAEVVEWRQKNSASFSQTAKHFGVSISTVKAYAALEKRKVEA